MTATKGEIRRASEILHQLRLAFPAPVGQSNLQAKAHAGRERCTLDIDLLMQLGLVLRTSTYREYRAAPPPPATDRATWVRGATCRDEIEQALL